MAHDLHSKYTFSQIPHKFLTGNKNFKVRFKFSEVLPNTVYVYVPGSKLSRFHAVNLSVTSDSVSQKIIVYTAPGVAHDILTCFNADLVLTDLGGIYRIPKKDGKTSLLNTVFISEKYKLFQDKKCKAACALGSSLLAVLLVDYLGNWTVAIYQHKNSQLQQKFTTNGTFRSIKNTISQPIITAFKAGCEKTISLPLNLISSLTKCPKRISSDSWLIVTCVGDGNIFSILYTEAKTQVNDSKDIVTPLFCFHQDILHIRKSTFKNGNSKVHSLSFVGVLGKIVVVTSSEDDTQPKIQTIEFYVPGPISCWGAAETCGVHSNGTALWVNHYELTKSTSGSVNPLITSRKISSESVNAVAIFNMEDDKKHVLISSTSGTLLIFKLTDLEQQDRNNFRNVSLDQSQLLNAIVQSSFKMTDIRQRHLFQKKLLDEMSCGSHLFFNKTLRHTFTTIMTSQWSPENPQVVEISVNVTNSGKYSVIGKHWRLIVRASSCDYYQSTSAPLASGIEIGHSVSVKTCLHFEDIIAQDNFPISVICNLQFCFEKSSASQNDNSSVNNEQFDSFSFIICLAEWQINELYYLKPRTNNEQPKVKHGINAALWDMAEFRLNSSFHSLSEFKKQFCLNFMTKPLEWALSISNNRIQSVINNQGNILQKVLTYIVKNSRCVDVAAVNQEINASVFGINISLSVASCTQDVITIKCASYSPVLLMKMKRSVCRRLKLYENPDLTADDETVKISSTIKDKYSEMESLFDECVDNQTKRTECLYRHFRDSISIEFPIR